MQENDEKRKIEKYSAYHAYNPNEPNRINDSKPEKAESPMPAMPTGPDPLEAAFPELGEKQQRKRRILGALGIVGFALALVAVAVLMGIFGGTDQTIGGPTGAAQSADPGAVSMATVFLKTQPWDTKVHSELKNLSKIKNFRYALQFFQSYNAAEIEKLPMRSCELKDAETDFETLAGTLAVLDNVSVAQTYPVDEATLPGAGVSTLLSLGTDPALGSVSLLVLGMHQGDAKTGDAMSAICIPVYAFAPENDFSSGGLLLVTVTGLVQKKG